MRARPTVTRYAVGLYRVSTAEQGQSGLGLGGAAGERAGVRGGPGLDIGRGALGHR